MEVQNLFVDIWYFYLFHLCESKGRCFCQWKKNKKIKCIDKIADSLLLEKDQWKQAEKLKMNWLKEIELRMVLLRMGARIEDGSDYGIYHGDKDEDNVVEDGVK